MLHAIPVAKGTAFSFGWEYVDLFGSFYPGVLLDYIEAFGLSRPTAVAGRKAASPAFRLSISPNPFCGKTHINYSLPQAGNVSVKLYDVAGSLVRTWSEGHLSAGPHMAELDAARLGRGIYILKFAGGNCRATAKLILE
jgi:hypothetical protein